MFKKLLKKAAGQAAGQVAGELGVGDIGQDVIAKTVENVVEVAGDKQELEIG